MEKMKIERVAPRFNAAAGALGTPVFGAILN